MKRFLFVLGLCFQRHRPTPKETLTAGVLNTGGSEAVAPTAILSTSGNASRRFLGLVDTAARTRSTQGLLAVSAAKIQMMFCVGELIQPNENP